MATWNVVRDFKSRNTGIVLIFCGRRGREGMHLFLFLVLSIRCL
jgi:hypothetical protein